MRDALNQLTGDYHIVCPSLDWARTLSTSPNRKVYNYILNYRLSNINWPAWAGVLHGYEIELMFGVPLRYRKDHDEDPYNEADRRHSALMVKYWLNFIHFGDPNRDFMSQNDRNRYIHNTDGLEYLSYKLPSWRSAAENDAIHLYINDMKYLSLEWTFLFFFETSKKETKNFKTVPQLFPPKKRPHPTSPLTYLQS